jgi:hypothetical protein
VPWHYHNNVKDTFYVLKGSLRLFLRDPKEEVRLGPGDSYTVSRRARTSSPTAARTRPRSWCCRGSGSTISFR